MSYFNKIQVYDKEFNETQLITPLGVAAADPTTRLVGSQFGDSNDINFWALGSGGSGASATTANNITTLVSGTGNSPGFGLVQSQQKARFLFTNPNKFRSISRITATSVTGNECWEGVFSPKVSPVVGSPDYGFYFKISESGVLSCCYKKNSSTNEVSVSSGSFNGDVSTYTVDTNFHAYEIVFFGAKAWYFIDGVHIHNFTPIGGTTTMCDVMNLYACSSTSNTGTSSRTKEIAFISIVRYGKENSLPIYKNITTNATTTLKKGMGTLRSITVNKKATTAGSCIVYDSTSGSGTTIATIDTTGTAGAVYAYGNTGVDFQIGLTIVTSAGSGAADLTFVYD